jgi:hypothetical protein
MKKQRGDFSDFFQNDATADFGRQPAIPETTQLPKTQHVATLMRQLENVVSASKRDLDQGRMPS